MKKDNQSKTSIEAGQIERKVATDRIICPVCELATDTEADIYCHLLTGHRKSTIVDNLLTYSTQFETDREPLDQLTHPRQSINNDR